jgi:hypothetical protein
MRIKTTAAGEKVEDDFLMSHADTISNGARYYYRIKGLTIFGITGNSSNTVGGIPGPDLDVAPVIESVDEQNGNRLLLKWSLPDSVQPVVAKYEIWRSTKYDTGFTRIAEVKAGIPFQKQLTITALPVNYIIVKAIGTREGQVVSSAPYLYQQIDSIAPAAPTGLSGAIDSNGVVTLTWKPNKEADMLGYRVLRATSKTAEFVVLNAKPGGALTFLDTVPVKQLNESIFYKIAAIDNRYNESQQSQIVEVKRPDKIPPTPARLRAVTYKEGRMHVSWIPSFSKDVVSYSLFRLASDDTSHTWKQVATLKNTDTTYTDRNITENTKYSYSIQAMDDANLLSRLSAVLSENVPKDRALKKGVRNFNTYVSREYKYIELNWQDNDAATNEYWLYRASGNGKLTLIVTLPGKTRKYVDEDLRASTSYRYAIKVVYKDGTGSKMEKTAVTY